MARFLTILLITITAAMAAQKSEFIILENPSTLHILNKYEQQASETFLKGTPFRILEKDFVLSDGISKCWKCTFSHKLYFITPKPAHELKIVKGNLLNDSVELVWDKISLKTVDDKNISLATGTNLQRIFIRGRLTYVFADQYGWCSLPKKSWRKTALEDTAAAFPLKIQQRIKAKIEAVNLTYRRFFSFFNQKYQRQLPVPQWHLEANAQQLRFYLQPEQTFNQFHASIPLLQQDIELIISDSNLVCHFENHNFLIMPRSQQ